MRQPRHPRKPRPQQPGSDGGNAGSPEPGFLIVGQIIRPHGVRGDVAMKLMTEYPGRLVPGRVLYVGPGHTPYTIRRIRNHQSGVLLQFEDIKDRNAAEELRGAYVHVSMEDAIPLEDGEYYLYQIEGIRVVTDAGDELGRLTGYIETGANDVYIITTPEEGEILLPAIPEVILKVDLEAKVMTVHLLEGLV